MTMAASSIFTFVVLRFLTGIGLGGVIPNVVALVSEMSPKRYRVVSDKCCPCPTYPAHSLFAQQDSRTGLRRAAHIVDRERIDGSVQIGRGLRDRGTVSG